jgi:hypothetical protein
MSPALHMAMDVIGSIWDAGRLNVLRDEQLGGMAGPRISCSIPPTVVVKELE